MGSDEELLVIDDQERNVKNFKSVYYQMNAKSDCITKLFTDNVTIDLDSINNLNDMICDKLRQYENAGFIINTTVKYKDKKNKFFPNWKSFENTKWTSDKSINKMTIKWEINIVFPNMGERTIPQKHTLLVKLSDRMRPEELLNLVFSGGVEAIEDLDREVFPIVASVDFINEQLGEELLDIVAKWNESLKNPPEANEKFMVFARKNKNKIANIINYVPNILFLICGLIYVRNLFVNLGCQTLGEISITDGVRILEAITFVVITCYVFRKIFYEIAKIVYNSINDYGEIHIFNITNGDKKEQRRISNSNTRKKKQTIRNIIATCILNIACGVVTSLLLK